MAYLWLDMSSWIFQARPDRYRLDTDLKVGKTDDWLATRYRADMAPGDKVFFWQAGEKDKRGVYGVGKIEAAPTQDDDGEYVVPVKVLKVLPTPVTSVDIGDQPLLKDLQILQIPIGTNFKMTDEESKTLDQLLSG
ncbi:EVE domain-containing protein [Terricaulis sp.]|uniref:EVE domain-containing protein n=1 Tax=Terricaulis sp. TaxID=2768686 RepID=UPI003782D2F3